MERTSGGVAFRKAFGHAGLPHEAATRTLATLELHQARLVAPATSTGTKEGVSK